MANGTFADPAGNPDGLEMSLQVQPVSIDKLRRMLHLAAQSDGITLHRREKCSAGLRHVPGKAEIAHPVWRFGQLPQKLSRRFKGAMHVPKRTGPAEPGELQARRRMALGYCSGLINPHEEEGDALGAGPLQGGKPVRDLLDRRTEKVGEPLEIVPCVKSRRLDAL